MRQRAKLTGSALSSRVAQWTQAGQIKNLQTAVITVGPAATTNTATLSPSVDPNNSLLFLLGQTYDAVDTDASSFCGRLTFTNATTITATRAGSSNTLTMGFLVVEFMPGVIKSMQANTITVTTSVTSTINPINTLKYHLSYLGCTSADISGSGAVFYPQLTLTNATTVTGSRGVNSTTCVVGYRIAEFY